MTSVLQVAQQLLQSEPQREPARLALYHYLKNFRALHPGDSAPGEEFTPELVNAFYARALSFTHWQQNAQALEREIRRLIEGWLLAADPDFAYQQVRHPTQMQLVTLEKPQDFQAVISQSVNKQLAKGDTSRLVLDQADRLLAFILTAAGGVRIHIYSPLMTIRQGELVPLVEDNVLYYTPNLELDPQSTQQIDLGPFLTARFHAFDGVCTGWILRGYTFQKFESPNESPMARFPKLFYAVKHLEQFFVRRESDSLYTELTALLEQAVELIQEGQPEGVKLGAAALRRAQLAFENIYTGDRVLDLLIRDLQNNLSQVGQNRSAPLPSPVLAIDHLEAEDDNSLDDFQMIKPMSL